MKSYWPIDQGSVNWQVDKLPLDMYQDCVHLVIKYQSFVHVQVFAKRPFYLSYYPVVYFPFLLLVVSLSRYIKRSVPLLSSPSPKKNLVLKFVCSNLRGICTACARRDIGTATAAFQHSRRHKALCIVPTNTNRQDPPPAVYIVTHIERTTK